MVEERKLTAEEQAQYEQMKQKMGEESIKRQEWIQKHVKEYYKALNGDKLSPEEILILGMDTIQAGYALVSRFSDMIQQGVDERMNTIISVREQIDKTLKGFYLDKDKSAVLVAKAAMHDFKANKGKLFTK